MKGKKKDWEYTAETRAWVCTGETMTSDLNDIKEMFLEAMLEEEQITKEQLDKINEYCLVVHQKGFFGSMWDKFWVKKPNGIKACVVKVIGY